MNDDFYPKLIQTVDPTKIKVTINEKFSKLTLSSNKKKNVDPVKEVAPEKRQSASRNLLEDLNDDSQAPSEDKRNSEHLNAILKSSSSVSYDKNETDKTESMMHGGNLDIDAQNVTAESLHLYLSEENEDLRELTQRVSNLTVSQVNGHVKNEILSNTKSFNDSEVIDLLTSEEEESVICLTDTDEEADNLPTGTQAPYNLMATSDIRQSCETGEATLPCTLSNERADRIEAFLKDVSQERRKMALDVGELENESLLAPLESSNTLKTPMKTVKQIKSCEKAKLIANADTESMETNTEYFLPSNNLPKDHEMGLNDTEPISDNADISILLRKSEIFEHHEMQKSLDVEARRLANDDTEANTTLGSVNETIINSDESRPQLIDNESIIISETSSEDHQQSQEQASITNENVLIPSEEALSESIRQINSEEQDSVTDVPVTSINISAKINIKLQIRANFSTSDGTNSNDSGDSGDSGDSEDNDPKNDETNNKNRSKDNEEQQNIESDFDENENNDHNLAKSKQSSNENASIITKENNKMKHCKDFQVETMPSSKNNDNLLTDAAKLLNELYGKSWQTPDLVRTLRRTNNSSLDDESPKRNNVRKQKAPNKSKLIEVSFLDDFSTFRVNIEKTNMDSTRLITPKTKNHLKEFQTEPKRQPNVSSKKQIKSVFKMPQTEFKNNRKVLKTTKERWRQILLDDSDSDKNNITDDKKMDKTILTDDESNEEDLSNASDSSWHELTEESSDDDFVNTKNSKSKTQNKTKARTINKKFQKERLVYMDLSKDEVSILKDTPKQSPPANLDDKFKQRLSQIFDNCRYEDKPKLPPTPKTSKRRLFTHKYDDYDDNTNDGVFPEPVQQKALNFDEIKDEEKLRLNGQLPPSYNIFNKRLEAVKTGKPVFKFTPPRSKQHKIPIFGREETTNFKCKDLSVISTPTRKNKCKLDELSSTPSLKYSFLKSLDVCVGKSFCHPDALIFRQNYHQKKEDLTKILYELFNLKLFDNKLNVPLEWNKKLLNTAGRCLNKTRAGQRLCVIQLSDKVLTSADRLRCTLIHELCHAATWIFNGEGGHGAKWKEWARKANTVFPDLPKIDVCHQYDIEYKYTYKCTLCGAKAYYHSKSKKVENIRCSYCHGAIEIFLNKKDKEGNVMPTPVREATGFAKFVKDNYQQYKRPNLKHAEVMKLLSNEYASLKVTDKAK